MDDDVEKRLKAVLRRSQELTQKTEKIIAQTRVLRNQTQAVLKQVKEAKTKEERRFNKKLGST